MTPAVVSHRTLSMLGGIFAAACTRAIPAGDAPTSAGTRGAGSPAAAATTASREGATTAASNDGRTASASSDGSSDGPFVVEESASYFGVDDERLVVRSADGSVDLLVSPQDATVARDSLGHFHAALDAALVARFADVLPDLLTPMPVPPSHVSPGDPPVTDAPSWGVTVERAGVTKRLRAPETHDVSPALRDLLAQASAEAMKHPVEAIRVAARSGAQGWELDVESIGSAPATFVHPLARPPSSTGLFVWRWDNHDQASAVGDSIDRPRRSLSTSGPLPLRGSSRSPPEGTSSCTP